MTLRLVIKNGQEEGRPETIHSFHVYKEDYPPTFG